MGAYIKDAGTARTFLIRVLNLMQAELVPGLLADLESPVPSIRLQALHGLSLYLVERVEQSGTGTTIVWYEETRVACERATRDPDAAVRTAARKIPDAVRDQILRPRPPVSRGRSLVDPR